MGILSCVSRTLMGMGRCGGACCKSRRIINAILVILFINLMMFNLLLYFAVIRPLLAASNSLVLTELKDDLQKVHDFDSFNTEFMAKRDFFRRLISRGKDGGIASLHDQLLGRIYMVSHNRRNLDTKAPKYADPGPDTISFFGVDVSDALEATYIYRRILQRKDFHVPRLIVDIGANDGLLSSNSFNFIHWGWSAILVEPQQKMLDMAKKNTKYFRDPYNDGKQRVEYVPAVIGDKDGRVMMAMTDDLVNMENYILTNHRMARGQPTVEVPSMTVKTFAEKLNVPKRFGILSIDAEGVGDKILHQFIDAGFRPEYVIYEPLHNGEHRLTTKEYMTSAGYRLLSTRGWNQIYERQRPRNAR